MALALSRRQRTVLLFLSASAYTAWLAGLGERLDAQDIARSRTASLRIAARPRLPSLATLVVRDPFEEVGARERRVPQHARAGVADAGDVVVPDIAPGAQTAALATTLAVRATIVGSSPVAYVASGSAMEVVRIGDTLDGRSVAKIDLRGVTFGDGTRLDLPGAFVATPAPQRAGRSVVTASLDDLRRLLRSPGRSSAPVPAAHAVVAPAASPPATPTAAPPASAAPPTPGPLPTADLRDGLAPGASRSPDPTAPTPFPYPYPYAPPAR